MDAAKRLFRPSDLDGFETSDRAAKWLAENVHECLLSCLLEKDDGADDGDVLIWILMDGVAEAYEVARTWLGKEKPRAVKEWWATPEYLRNREKDVRRIMIAVLSEEGSRGRSKHLAIVDDLAKGADHADEPEVEKVPMIDRINPNYSSRLEDLMDFTGEVAFKPPIPIEAAEEPNGFDFLREIIE